MGVFDILTENLVVKVRLVIYGILIFFSFFIFVGASVMKDRYSGYCPLYATISNISPPVSNCNYPIAIAIIFQLFYVLYRVVVLVLLVLGKLKTEMFVFSNILELVYVLVDLAACILTFIAACILSAGHNVAGLNYDDRFKTPSNIAQAGAWISTVSWLFITIIGVIYILRSGKLPFMRNSAPATTGNTGPAVTGVQHVETPPNYNEPPKY
jgi:hypothetical protein